MLVLWLAMAAVLGAALGYGICRRRSRADEGPSTDDGEQGDPEAVREFPSWYAWLADAPLFLDRKLVASFHDAVLRPRFRPVSGAMSTEFSSSTTVKDSGGIKLGEMMPGLELSVSTEVSDSQSRGQARSLDVEFIHNPNRDLLQLVEHYLAQFYPEVDAEQARFEDPRLRIWEELQDPHEHLWEEPTAEQIVRRPRMLACLDFPPGSKFIPVALETSQGVNPVYEALIEALQARGGHDCPPCPPHPDRQDPTYVEKNAAYWDWFDEHWHAPTALVCMEKATTGGARPRWVNYRVPVQKNLTLHVNMVGGEEYDAGVFAYNLIKRGSNHGLRFVGTVRAEPGINVLAVYDK